jgi:hypothetical protein
MSRLRHALVAAATLSLLTSSLAIAAKPTAPPALGTLEPGGTIEIDQELPINVVFVGYDLLDGTDDGPQSVDEVAFLDGLADTYDTIYRFKAFYGLPADAGINFSYDYNVVWTDEAFEDAFFGMLAAEGEAAPLTAYQEAYNDEAAATQQVDPANNIVIDATTVENWLANNSPVDTSQYTIFFINWWGRDDFKFHVYSKLGEPDADTGVDAGEADSRKIIAWGGTTDDDEEGGLDGTHRIWFYDLSAGPEFWTDNWNLTDADVDGNDVLDYRMPPVWEYGNLDAYRPFDDLSGDLAKVARFVAINLLFTASPLYVPALSGPALPDSIELDVTAFDNAGTDVAALFDAGLIVDELSELKPDTTFSLELTILELAGRVEAIYDCFIADVSCFGSRLFGIAFADLFLYFNDHILQFLDGDADYELGIFAFYGAEDFEAGGLLGFADDNWTDGTQSFVFEFTDPLLEQFGFGFTGTTIHEVGHHIGMSHPHDGFDSESGIDYGPGDDFYFTWSGSESNTVMSYTNLNWDFSQFDRDNMARYMTAAYLNTANSVLGQIYASPRAGQVAGMLTDADADAAAALAAYDAFDWAGAAALAKAAYDAVMDAAAAINVQIEPQAWAADLKAKGHSYAFVDPLTDRRIPQ